MKKVLIFFILINCSLFFAQELKTEDSTEMEQNQNDENPIEIEKNENAESLIEEKSELKSSKAGISEVPPKKRPRPIDKEKAEKSAEKDENSKDAENYLNTIKYGIPSEIAELLTKLTENDDPRFTEEIYDVFYESQNSVIKTGIIKYFTKLKDPCLEDFAVTVLNDPYDEKSDLVRAVFQYVSEVKTKQAIPAILSLIESENEIYFTDAISTIGEIGQSSEALFLTEFLEREDLSDAQRQTLMRTCGKMHAIETWQKIVDILNDEDENTFVRMYAAEAIGLMQKEESVKELQKHFSSTDPSLRQYVIKGLVNFPENENAQQIIIQAIRDEHWKVRQEAIKSVKQNNLTNAVDFLIYRAKNDSEKVIKDESLKTIASLNCEEGNNYLLEQLSDKKISDATKKKVVEVILKEDKFGENEILQLAQDCINDDKRKDLRYAIGKELAKKQKSSYEDICIQFLSSKDTTTISLGLDIYKQNKFESAKSIMYKLYEEKKTNASIKSRIKKMLNIEDENEKNEDK